MIKVLACSERVIEQVMGPPQRGLVHSAFSSAANLLFPPDFLLSLNYFPLLNQNGGKFQYQLNKPEITTEASSVT
ncbi:MAG TPA: hypothetical protein VF458_10040, partial [Ktedonobacteraceae bacterium]